MQNNPQSFVHIPICCLAIALSLLLIVAPAQAAQKQIMSYDVYAGGFHVVLAELTLDTTPKNGYVVKLDTATRGFLDKLVRWKGVFGSKGWRNKAGDVRAQEHFSETTSGDDYEKKTYLYGKDGSFQSYRVKDEHDDGKKPREVDPALTKNTTDALTATIAVMQEVANGGNCTGSDEVFDGSRRYRLSFHHQKNVILEGGDYNVYSGPAQECTVEVKPLKGKWHEKPRGWMSIQEQGRKAGTMPTIWFAKVANGEPAVPVKIRVKTDYGTLFMHLTGYQNGQKTLSKKSR